LHVAASLNDCIDAPAHANGMRACMLMMECIDRSFIDDRCMTRRCPARAKLLVESAEELLTKARPASRVSKSDCMKLQCSGGHIRPFSFT
jgi:hypothetical protein